MSFGNSPTAAEKPFLERIIKLNDFSGFKTSINHDVVVNDSS